MTDIYLKKVATGSGNGSGWDNAKAFTDSTALRVDLETLRAGDTLYIGNDFGKRDWLETDILMIVNAVNGTEDDPITFCGSAVTDTTELHAAAKGKGPIFHGGAEAPMRLGDSKGVDFLRVERDHYKFLGLNLVNAGYFLTIRNRPVTGITVADCQTYGTELVFSCGAGDSDVTGLDVSNFIAGNVSGGFGLFRNGKKLSFSDVHVSHSEETTDVFGLKFGAAGDASSVVEEILVRDSSFTGGYNFNGSPSYVQGDGIIAEIGTSEIDIDNVRISLYGDAAIDLKSTNARIKRADIQRCKYGIKLWGLGENLIENSIVSNCSLGAIQCIADIVAKNSTFKGTADSKCLLNLTKNNLDGDKLGELTLEDCVLEYPDPSRLIYGYAGNKVHMKNCMVNGVLIKETKFLLPAQGSFGIVDDLTDF
ncbi:hypothetical protein [Vibrio phage vB_VmeM-Yong XC32]|nr:hypothetical protein [Vibrio phage vB_VmeM-Yong XC31]QAX96515.1 hypothetical protein [Vibrio phage vB_VmeM-Yong XC32]QAX96832.1 hypothetical protein [Vibrio phage vB_VmeM-Yong MS31]